MKKIIILLPILLLFSSCGPGFSIYPDQTSSSYWYPTLRIIVVNQTNQQIEIFNDRGEVIFEVGPRGIRILDINYCYERNYILLAREKNGKVRYRTFWCGNYGKKEVWEIY